MCGGAEAQAGPVLHHSARPITLRDGHGGNMLVDHAPTRASSLGTVPVPRAVGTARFTRPRPGWVTTYSRALYVLEAVAAAVIAAAVVSFETSSGQDLQLVAAAAALVIAWPLLQIGRASCRERV